MGAAKGIRCVPGRPGCLARCCRGLRFDLSATGAGRFSVGTVSGDPVDDVRLEIGFGGAEHLIAQARRAFPHTGFIGC